MGNVSTPESTTLPGTPSRPQGKLASASASDGSDGIMANPKSRDRRLWSLACTPPLLVLVGPASKPFYLQRGLLRKHSLYFRAMLRNHFVETQDSMVLLPDDDILAFGCFVEWLYIGDRADTAAVFEDAFGTEIDNDDDAVDDQVDAGETADRAMGETERESLYEISVDVRAGPVKREVMRSPKPTDHSSEEELIDIPIKAWDFGLQFACYVLADKLQADGFKAHIMRELNRSIVWYYLERRQESLTVDHVRYAYRHTTDSDDQLRPFCIRVLFGKDATCTVLQDRRLKELCKEDVGAEIIGDVLMKLAGLAVRDQATSAKAARSAEKNLSSKDKELKILRTDLSMKEEMWRQEKHKMTVEKYKIIVEKY